MNYIRTLVSGKKNRYIDENYNLDLTYITPRIIAMAFPASGIKTIYRNKLEDVSNFLNEKHSNHFMILNLSGNKYDSVKFNGCVIDFDQWLDHHAPPIELLFILVEKMHGFLEYDIENVVVVNCNAGKGRTGTLICCYLLYSGMFHNIQDAFDYYSLKRFSEGFGVTHASQKRYVSYFFQVLTTRNFPIPCQRILTKIETTCYPYSGITTMQCDYGIYDNKNNCLHNNENNRREIKINLLESDETLVFSEDNLNLKLHGDILIELYNYRFVKSKKKLGRISFNTSFIDRKSNTLEFELREIDPYEFSIKTNVRTDYKIKLTFEKVCENDSMYCNDITDLCEKCQKIMEEDVNIYKTCKKVILYYNPKNPKGKKLLFGKNLDDIEETLKKRDLLRDPNSNSGCNII